MGEKSRVTKLIRDVEKGARYNELKKKLHQIREFSDPVFCIFETVSPPPPPVDLRVQSVSVSHMSPQHEIGNSQSKSQAILIAA